MQDSYTKGYKNMRVSRQWKVQFYILSMYYIEKQKCY